MLVNLFNYQIKNVSYGAWRLLFLCILGKELKFYLIGNVYCILSCLWKFYFEGNTMRVEYLKHKYNIGSYHLNLSGFESSVVNILHAFVFLFAFQINPNS